MKTKVFFIVVIFCMFTACVNAQTTSFEQRIVGTWVGTVRGETRTLVFNANGSGSVASNRGTDTFTFGVNVVGTVRIIYANEVDYNPSIFLSPDGRTMILDNEIYRKR